MVPNWDKFQHYTDRDPPWIKVYTDLTANDEWMRLKLAERGLLVLVWVEFSRSNGHLSVRSVRRLCGKSARSSHLEALNDAGFIRFSASKPLALARTREKRREEKKEKRASTRTPKTPVTAAPNMPARDEAAYVRGLIANHIITEPYELDAYNLDDALKVELAAQL